MSRKLLDYSSGSDSDKEVIFVVSASSIAAPGPPAPSERHTPPSSSTIEPSSSSTTAPAASSLSTARNVSSTVIEIVFEETRETATSIVDEGTSNRSDPHPTPPALPSLQPRRKDFRRLDRLPPVIDGIDEKGLAVSQQFERFLALSAAGHYLPGTLASKREMGNPKLLAKIIEQSEIDQYGSFMWERAFFFLGGD